MGPHTGAAYLERWGIDNSSTNFEQSTVGHEQETHRSLLLSAAQRARALTAFEAALTPTAYILAGDYLVEPTITDFALDL